MSADRPSWLVFYGTHTAIVKAADEWAAYRQFVSVFSPDHGDKGRLAPPTRNEVRIRRPTEADRGWIEDSRSPVFMALLREIPA